MCPQTAPESLAGRYDLGETLGRGGMAEVRAGVDRRLDRPVAVKLLLPELADDPGIRARFETEARAAARLVHPNVTAVFDTGEEHGTPYLVMERLRGVTLADRIAEGPLPPEEARRVGLQVLGALQAAHDAGIVHRDVKPGNVLHTHDGRWKVADFGIAKSIESVADLTVTSGLICTPAYVAPERLEGTAADPASDLYSVGVLLYEALTGRKPFEGDTAIALAHAIRSQHPAPLSELRPGLDDGLISVVERAMARDPSRRFGSAAEMAAALKRRGVARDDTVPDAPRTAPTETLAMTTPPRRRPRSGREGARRRFTMRQLATVAVAGGAALALGIGVVAAVNRDDGGTSGGDPPAATIADDVTVTGEPLPPEYRDALEELARSVQP